MAKGFQQLDGVNLVDRTAAMEHPITVCTALAMAAAHGWYANSTDIKLAFLNAQLHVCPLVGLEEGHNLVYALCCMAWYSQVSSGGVT